jgi:Zn-dependent peptidase ImmA (M78 family)
LPIFADKSSDEIRQIQESFSDDEYRIIEKDAKYLAGCLLMPRAIFRERFNHFYALQSQRTGNNLLVNRHVIKQLSLDFNVSCFSVGIRATHLDLLDQEELNDLIEAYGW